MANQAATIPAKHQDHVELWPDPPFIHSYRDDGVADFGREQVITLLCQRKEVEELRVDIAHTDNPGGVCWDACKAALDRHIKECRHPTTEREESI